MHIVLLIMMAYSDAVSAPLDYGIKVIDIVPMDSAEQCLELVLENVKATGKHKTPYTMFCSALPDEAIGS